MRRVNKEVEVMDYNEAVLGHLQNILRANNPDAARLIYEKQQAVLADITSRGRVYDGGGMGQLVTGFLTLIRDTVQAEWAETKRIFSMPQMPVDDLTKATVKGLLLGRMGLTVRLAQEAIDRLSISHPQVPRLHPPLHVQVQRWESALESEIDLFFHAVNGSQQGQRVLRGGQMFEGNLALREILESAQSSIAITDPYIGPRLFNLLTARQAGVMIRLLSNKISPADLQTAEDFKAEYGYLQLRLQKTGMHDRFLIIDGLTAYSVGHSLKDLGSKDSVVSESPDPATLVKLFEERWAVAEIKL